MNPALLLPVILIGVAVGDAFFYVATRLEDRQVVRNSLRQLDGYEVENQRDAELLAPLKDRAWVPFLQGLTSL